MTTHRTNNAERLRRRLEHLLRALAREAEDIANRLQSAQPDGWQEYALLRFGLSEDVADLAKFFDDDDDENLEALTAKLLRLVVQSQPATSKE